MKNNKGFTLIELIVAVVVSVFASASIYLILNLCFTQYKLVRCESQIMIEAQEITEKLKPVLMCCEYIKQQNTEGATNKYTRIKSKDSEGNTKYYYLILSKQKLYLVTSNDHVNFSDLTWDSSNYMAQYVQSIQFEPNVYEFRIDGKKDTIECKVYLEEGGVSYDSSFKVRVRGKQ